MTAKRVIWTPVADGTIGADDTITVSCDGSFIEVRSKYGDGSRTHQAMTPLPDTLRLCERVDDAPAVTVTAERIAALQALCNITAHHVLFQAEREIVRAMLAEIEGEPTDAT